MFDFFIALFGGLYYVGKSSSEKSKTKDAAHRNKTYDAVDATLRQYRNYPKTLADGWVMLNEIQNELEDLFGVNWAEIYKNCSGGFLSTYPHPCENPNRTKNPRRCCQWNIWAIAYNIWLSKQGYISDVEYDINNPQNFGEIENYHWLQKYPILNDTQKLLTKMYQMIELNIQNKHPDLKLGLWLHRMDESSDPWHIKWSYYFDRVGYTPTTKPW